MKKLSLIFALLLVLVSCVEKKTNDNSISVIPMPESIRVDEGTFCINKDTKIFLDVPSEEMKRVVGFLNERLKVAAGFELEIVDEVCWENVIMFMNADFPSERYVINCRPDVLTIEVSWRGHGQNFHICVGKFPPRSSSKMVDDEPLILQIK